MLSKGRNVAQHPSWPKLTDEQREAVNRVWDEMVVPALESVATYQAVAAEAAMDAQDARGEARRAREDSERRAENERERRQALYREIAQLKTRILELEGMELAA